MKGLAVIGLALLVVLGYAVATGDAQSPPRAADRLDLGVVAIEARVGGDAVHGSGTVIDAERGLVLTSARSVWGATSLKLSTGLGIVHGRIVARAPCDELAVLEVQPHVPGLVSLAATAAAAPATGTVVTAYGRRLTSATAGLLTLPARVMSAPLRLDALLVPEAAGGPVVDARGRLVGIATPIGTAIPWETVKQRLDELQPGPRRVFAGWRGQYDCAARLNRVTKTAHPAFTPADARLVVDVPATRIPGSEEVDAR